MGQATSSPNSISFFQKFSNSDKNEYQDVSNKFTKATLSTLTVPVIVIAYPALNAYAFQDMDITGYRLVDGAIGGVLGVIACNVSLLCQKKRTMKQNDLIVLILYYRAIVTISCYMGCSENQLQRQATSTITNSSRNIIKSRRGNQVEYNVVL